MQRLVSLNVMTDNIRDAGSVYATLTKSGRDFIVAGYTSVSVSSQVIGVDAPEDDAYKMLSFKVHEILCRLGMTETEAHNAITQIHAAHIKFAQE